MAGNEMGSNRTRAMVEKSRDSLGRFVHLYDPRTWKEKGLKWTAGLMLFTYLVVVCVLGVLWSFEPDTFDVREYAMEQAGGDAQRIVTGWTTAATAIGIADTLLSKQGGYLRNDIFPPGLLLDNIPEWEFGALNQLRDTARMLRNEFSRSQTQSAEDKNLADAQTFFNNDANKWWLPSAEGRYREGIGQLRIYMERLADANDQDGQFFARADNLAAFLQESSTRLGGHTQKLAASVGQARINVDLAGDPAAQQSTPAAAQREIQTPWLEIDNVFFEARGYAWALLQMFRAIEVDFESVLRDKNALPSVRQIIRELEGAQGTLVTRFIVLNGHGFGLFPNHSLVLASYLSRANAAMLDLRRLLQQG